MAHWRVWTSVIILVAAGCSGQASSPVPGVPTQTQPAKRHHHRASPATVSVSVHPSQVLATVSPLILGAGMPVWYNITTPGIVNVFTGSGMRAIRWPGGKAANWYHWKTNTSGIGNCSGKPDKHSTFDNFMNYVAIPAHLDVAITVNYGSNPSCDAGADPTEAADWVAYANATQKYNIQWWTVGNEQYTPQAIDLHWKPHDPTLYAQLVASDFYTQMHAASPTPINVCVGVQPKKRGWDPIVLALAKYDCVEMHFYAQSPQNISDTYLLQQAVPVLHGYLTTLKTELTAAGHPNLPIYMGEIGSSTEPSGKQSQSIVQALFAGEVIGELVNDGIARATWHLGNGSCSLPSAGGDFNPSIYGWQDWGGAMIFADDQQFGCPTKYIPTETPLATADAYQVLSNFAHPGESALATTVTGMPDILAYATTDAGGDAVMLINLNETTTEDVGVAIDGKSGGSGGSITTYDKDIYDQTKNNVWAGPTTASLGPWSGSFTISMPPWSMIVVQTQ